MTTREPRKQWPVRAYLAASWERAESIYDYCETYNPFIEFTSTWHELAIEEKAKGFPESQQQCREYTNLILKEIAVADILILDTRSGSSKGGMHNECGMAIALGKPVFIVGRPLNLFHVGAEWREYNVDDPYRPRNYIQVESDIALWAMSEGWPRLLDHRNATLPV